MNRAFRWTGSVAVVVMAAACEVPPPEVDQTGFRGLGLEDEADGAGDGH